MNSWRNILAFFFLGVLADFITGGVFKIIWFAIYATTYFALAMTLGTYVSRFSKHDRRYVICFLLGTALGHFIFVGHHHQQTFTMTVDSYAPITLTSPEFSESLFLTSEELSSRLGGTVRTVQVRTESLSDYACVKSFDILSVDGVDLRNATWTWRAKALGVRTNFDSPTTTRSRWPWCWYQFYRS